MVEVAAAHTEGVFPRQTLDYITLKPSATMTVEVAAAAENAAASGHHVVKAAVAAEVAAAAPNRWTRAGPTSRVIATAVEAAAATVEVAAMIDVMAVAIVSNFVF